MLLPAIHSVAQELPAKYSSEIANFYQSFTYDLESCNCNFKTERTDALTKRMIPEDFTNYKLIAYEIKISEPLTVAALAKVMEQDFSVLKAGFADRERDDVQDYLYLLVSDKFDNASFEQAASTVFQHFKPANAAEVLEFKDAKLYQSYLKANSQ